MNKYVLPGVLGASVIGLSALALVEPAPIPDPVIETPAPADPAVTGTEKETVEQKDVSASDRYDTVRAYPDRDCGEFSSRAEAQAFFESQGPGDPHGLDRDGDGEACETLP